MSRKNCPIITSGRHENRNVMQQKTNSLALVSMKHIAKCIHQNSIFKSTTFHILKTHSSLFFIARLGQIRSYHYPIMRAILCTMVVRRKRYQDGVLRTTGNTSTRVNSKENGIIHESYNRKR